MTPEIFNYFRRWRNPAFAVEAIYAMGVQGAHSIVSRALPNRRYFVPAELRDARRAVLANKNALEPGVESDFVPASLRLASGWIDFRESSQWLQTFDDIEQTVSLHRWNWLLHGLTDSSRPITRDNGIALMRSWICACSASEPLRNETYTVGERVANGCLFLLLTGGREIPPDLALAFRSMGCEVAERLEYYRSGDTGNHAFNNARALLFAGLVADLPGASELALQIIQERLPTLVTSDGFLDEGSSHYHFLFTRWVLEMVWLARRYDRTPIVEFLKPYARMLVARCWFFLVPTPNGESSMPLIGDVSPDFTPDWLLSTPWSALALEFFAPEGLPDAPEPQGWASLFAAEQSPGTALTSRQVESAQRDWVRHSRAGWTTIVHAAAKHRTQATHAHNDLCGLVLYDEGRRVLVDCGRVDYTMSPLSRYGKSVRSHNSICVEQLGPAAEGPAWFAPSYLNLRTEIKVVSLEGSDSIVISHSGFQRLSGSNLLHERQIELGENVAHIHDRLQGSGTRRITLRFHFAPGISLVATAPGEWRLSGSRIIFRTELLPEANVQRGQRTPPEGGLLFPEYGAEQGCDTLELSGVLTLPVTLKQSFLKMTQ